MGDIIIKGGNEAGVQQRDSMLGYMPGRYSPGALLWFGMLEKNEADGIFRESVCCWYSPIWFCSMNLFVQLQGLPILISFHHLKQYRQVGKRQGTFISILRACRISNANFSDISPFDIH